MEGDLLYSVSEPIAHRKETRLPVAGERIVRIKADMNAFDKAISSSFQKIDDGAKSDTRTPARLRRSTSIGFRAT